MILGEFVMPSADPPTLSVDQLSVLYRLYLEWPETREMSVDREADEFYFWLMEDLGEDLGSLVSGLSEIKIFLMAHHAVLARARQIKARHHEVQTNARDNNRIYMNTQVFFLVYDCQAQPELEGIIERGILVDIAKVGMRIETNFALPRGTVLSLTAVQVNSDVRLYHLTGEVRWAIEHGNSRELGLSIFKVGDNEAWRELYELASLEG
ncbi:MAG: hypothetical protein ACI82A_003866 [Candidatus Azotimanducaceae bacterium]